MSEPQHDALETAPSPSAEARPEPRADGIAQPRRTMLAAALAALAVVIVAAASSPYWAPPLAVVLPWSPRGEADALAGRFGDIDQRLAAMVQQQAGFEARVARLEQQAKSATAGGPTQMALEQRLASLEQRVGAGAEHASGSEQRAERFQDQTSVSLAALRDQVEKLAAAQQSLDASAKERGADGTDQALLLALEPLRNAIESARPFTSELSAIEALARDRPEVKEALKPLEAMAAKGVADKLALARRFAQEVAPAMLRAAAEPREDSWSERVWSGLRSLVVIRRVDGTTSGDPTEAAVARAEKALVQNDLAGAVKAVEEATGRATGPVQAAAQAWLAAARERVGAEATLQTLSRQLTARLAAGADRSQPR